MTDPNQKPDMDLIEMVQRARMLNDASARPSDVAAVYWIEAKGPQTPAPTPNAGAWIIQTTVDAVDALWARIKAATEDGQLGYKSKVSTSPGKRQGRATQRLIHVRTYDSTDEADRARVREALRELGIEDDIVYEADKASTTPDEIDEDPPPSDNDGAIHV